MVPTYTSLYGLPAFCDELSAMSHELNTPIEGARKQLEEDELGFSVNRDYGDCWVGLIELTV